MTDTLSTKMSNFFSKLTESASQIASDTKESFKKATQSASENINKASSSAKLSYQQMMIPEPNIESRTKDDKLILDKFVQDYNTSKSRLCKAIVSCEVGQYIYDMLEKHVNEIGEAYINELTQIKESNSPINELMKKTNEATKKYNINLVSDINLPEQSYQKCIVMVVNNLNQNGETTSEIEGRIISIHPEKKELSVKIENLYKQNLKDGGTIKKNPVIKKIKLENLCVESINPDNSQCDLTKINSHVEPVVAPIPTPASVIEQDKLSNPIDPNVQAGGRTNKSNNKVYMSDINKSDDSIGICE